MDANGFWHGLTDSSPANSSQASRRSSPIGILIIGAGSRGQAYARAIEHSTDATVAAVAEPVDSKRDYLGKKYIWKNATPIEGQSFSGWQEFVDYEITRRKKANVQAQNIEKTIDAVFVCVLDGMHKQVVTSLAHLDLHILCEKPLATSLLGCIDIYSSLMLKEDPSSPLNQRKIFGIGHVLRYSPLFMLLRKLLLDDKVVGDIISVEHTEPVGWWHFAHSYVRGNWRKESYTAPSLLTKSCHDIDILLWLLSYASSSPASGRNPHLPSTVTSSGHVSYFRRARKPPTAGPATNCLSCPIERSCIYSAKHIYNDLRLGKGHAGWPVNVIDSEIEDIYRRSSQAAQERLMQRIGEDYDAISTPQSDVEMRPWFGRCVWESDNDVCDDQTVTLTWNDDPPNPNVKLLPNQRFAKTATFHMIAQTAAQCHRRGRVYGTHGEIAYESGTNTIHVLDFVSGQTHEHVAPETGGGHGGGDEGLVQKFVSAVEAVEKQGVEVKEAQQKYIGCDLDDILRSHALVFAAEEARREKKVLDWGQWWGKHVAARLGAQKEGKRVADAEEGWDVVTP